MCDDGGYDFPDDHDLDVDRARIEEDAGVEDGALEEVVEVGAGAADAAPARGFARGNGAAHGGLGPAPAARGRG